jgi:GNAT superfamily N-acetyltransferase
MVRGFDVPFGWEDEHLRMPRPVPHRRVRFMEYVESVTEDGRRNVAMRALVVPNVAVLQWEVVSGEIDYVRVYAPYQRQGIATRLWCAANLLQPVLHSAWRSTDGDAWARAVGGDLPKNEWH